MNRERPVVAVAWAVLCAALPVALLESLATRQVAYGGTLHLLGVGISAALATAAALALTIAGARERDGRAVVVGGAFSLMAALLLLHGLATPGLLVGRNGVVAFTGAATLAGGGAVLALAAVRALHGPRVVPWLLAGIAAGLAGVLGLGIAAVFDPALVPSVPEPAGPLALGVMAGGLVAYGLLLWRALRTYALARRGADLLVAVGIVWLAASLVPSLVLGYSDLGWWLGHGFEVVGIALVGVPVAADLRRARPHRSRPIVGDLRSSDLVAAEEAFLGSHVRALLVALERKDVSTEEHTRRVALRAVQVGERLGLSAARLRGLALGGLLHDIGKLSVPDAILLKAGPLSDEEFAEIRRHPVQGAKLLLELGGFPDAVVRLVRDHHERLDGSGYPAGAAAARLDLDTRIMAVCDVWDALVSSRVYREAWTAARALAHLRERAGSEFDGRVIDALAHVLHGEGLAVTAGPEAPGLAA